MRLNFDMWALLDKIFVGYPLVIDVLSSKSFPLLRILFRKQYPRFVRFFKICSDQENILQASRTSFCSLLWRALPFQYFDCTINLKLVSFSFIFFRDSESKKGKYFGLEVVRSIILKFHSTTFRHSDFWIVLFRRMYVNVPFQLESQNYFCGKFDTN